MSMNTEERLRHASSEPNMLVVLTFVFHATFLLALYHASQTLGDTFRSWYGSTDPDGAGGWWPMSLGFALCGTAFLSVLFQEHLSVVTGRVSPSHRMAVLAHHGFHAFWNLIPLFIDMRMMMNIGGYHAIWFIMGYSAYSIMIIMSIFVPRIYFLGVWRRRSIRWAMSCQRQYVAMIRNLHNAS